MLIRTDATNCATLTEKELSQHCAVVSCEHRNSTRSHDCRLFQSGCRIPRTLSSKKNLNCWIDTRLIHGFRDFTGFVHCTFQMCFRRFQPYQCDSHGSHVLSSLIVMSLTQLLLSHVESLGSILCPSTVTEREFARHRSSPDSNCFRALTLCCSIRIVHRVIPCRFLSTSFVLTVI